jgi:general secretion pathway protein D
MVPREERYVTRLMRLKYITTEEVVQVLNRLKGRDGDIMPYAAANTLVVTDLASNIRRMEEVVRALDQPMAGEKIWVVRLKNIVATEVLQMLQQVFGVGKTSGPGQPRRAPDPGRQCRHGVGDSVDDWQRRGLDQPDLCR